jgi:uncharacterized protein YydD (DUF2326 family)
MASFKPVILKNSTGLNFIVASQKHPGESLPGKSTNGVGKSLLVAIIHFCLGSNKKDGFKKQLPGWVFKLRFNIGDKEYFSERSTSEQERINFNGKFVKISTFTKELGELLFDIPEAVKVLTFRSLLPFFIRPRRASYSSFSNPNDFKTDYQVQIVNSFLLGLDVHLVREKFDLRNDKVRIAKLEKELKNDEVLKDFFLKKRDASLAKPELIEKIGMLEKDLKEFEIAEDYYEIKLKADKLKTQIEKNQNDLVLKQNQIKNIDLSRKTSPDIKKENIERIYIEASIVLNQQALKQLADLEDFYKHLSINRERRLLDQKRQLEKESEELSKNISKLSREFDGTLKYLDAHQALDVFVKLTSQVTDLKSELENISRYEDLFTEYRKSKNELDIKFIKATEDTESYLKDAADVVNQTRSFFRELSKKFYPHSPAGITINNNTRDNQIRFDIDAKIEADASDGINSVKIFCYDLTLLLHGFAHKIDFLFHDSRLLDGIDPRQIVELFRIVQKYISVSNKQYILTLNQNQIEEVRKYMSKEEFESIIENNICLHLKDDSPSDKLLGIPVDMDYD